MIDTLDIISVDVCTLYIVSYILSDICVMDILNYSTHRCGAYYLYWMIFGLHIHYSLCI